MKRLNKFDDIRFSELLIHSMLSNGIKSHRIDDPKNQSKLYQIPSQAATATTHDVTCNHRNYRKLDAGIDINISRTWTRGVDCKETDWQNLDAWRQLHGERLEELERAASIARRQIGST
jgi:hypothetical protein